LTKGHRKNTLCTSLFSEVLQWLYGCGKLIISQENGFVNNYCLQKSKKEVKTLQKEREFIREKLAKFSLSQIWLINELEERGIVTDKTELCSVIKGTRRGPKSNEIITTSVDILTAYEKRYKECP